jgi:CDP-diacylglycerol--glycerol-3-phosphate 3-phosphatidyltransferase
VSAPPEANQAGAVSWLVRLTSVRIALVPAVMGLIVLDRPAQYEDVAAAIVFTVAAATDFLDGYLARRWQVTSTLGSFLDTTADKLLVSGALIALVADGRASPWIATVIVGRELLIMGLRGVVASEGAILQPSIWGKLKTNVQFLAILLAILRYEDPIGPLFLDEWAMLAAAIVTVLSAVEYLARFWPMVTQSHSASPR